jgi:trans-2,3-dihydro-3-hydroxyanthranilate isomerase
MLADGSHDWIVEQGVEMGRPSRIRVRFDVAGGAIESLRIGGHAVPMMVGRLRAGN